MELSIFLAKIIAIVYAAFGVSVLAGQVTMKKILKSFSESTALVLFTGMVAVVVGMLIVRSHNIWTYDWTVVITIIGWIAIVKGVAVLMLPETFIKLAKAVKLPSVFIGVLSIAIAIVFAYFGFVV